MPSLLDISLLVAGGLFLPIRLPCFIPGVMEHAPACQTWAASLPVFDEHVFLIEMRKNLALTLVLLCAWASLLQTSVATKKAVLRAVASLMSIQSLWAAFVAHGLASPEMLGCSLFLAALMVAAILLTAPDAKENLITLVFAGFVGEGALQVACVFLVCSHVSKSAMHILAGKEK